MFDRPSSKSGLGIHVVLATVPQRQEKDFIESVDRNYYKRYRESLVRFSTTGKKKPSELYCPLDTTKSVPVLYNPLRYHLLGNYDIACISLIDNFKFSQRLFEPELKNKAKGGQVIAPYSFQGFTGTSFHAAEDLKVFFYERLKSPAEKQRYFLGICNLKLNNAFLIGNGANFQNSVWKMVEKVIEDFNRKASEARRVDWFGFQPFSWFEQSLILLTDNPESIVEINRTLRRLYVSQLENSDLIIKNSLYKGIFKNKSIKEIASANVLADTHTYFGVHAKLIEGPKNDPFFKSFLKKAPSIKFKTEIELQVKPGHMHLLMRLLKKVNKTSKLHLDLTKSYLVTGKSDYMLREVATDIRTNVHLLRLSMDANSGMYDHVRKMRTRMLFDVSHDSNGVVPKNSISLYSQLKKLGKTMDVINGLDKKLKALKVSRQIRNKVHKIFTNYNNGIQDAILFTYFLDFKIFVDDVQDLIEKEYNLWFYNQVTDDSSKKKNASDMEDASKKENVWDIPEKDWLTLSVLENKLMNKIGIFQEGYNIRMLNCYQYEDLADFDLDFNSSIQQLLSAYNSLVLEIANQFYDNKYQYGPVVQLNLKDTVSTYNSINYYVHHLTSPEIVFSTITKEILNCDQYDTEFVLKVHESFEKLEPELEAFDSHLYLLKKEGLVDLNYFLIDSTRFGLSFDFDFDLFYFWFWSYNLQNTMLYDKSGLINERHFRKELFRILSVAIFFNIPESKLHCPLPEMQTYWARHYLKIKKYVELLHTFMDKANLVQDVADGLLQRFSDFYSIFGKLPEGKFQYSQNTKDKLRMLGNIKKEYGGNFHAESFYAQDLRQAEFNSSSRESSKVLSDAEYLYFYMLEFLRTFKDENDGKIHLIRRNWKTGEPLEGFIKANVGKHIYSIDQTGGLFFDNMTELSRYYGISTKLISDILHFSNLAKKKFVLYHIGKPIGNGKK
ncbi:MAG: hypothetical protein QM781_08835 [Chitinophagaceae bacterium]